jgi:hypothetical protein
VPKVPGLIRPCPPPPGAHLCLCPTSSNTHMYIGSCTNGSGDGQAPRRVERHGLLSRWNDYCRYSSTRTRQSPIVAHRSRTSSSRSVCPAEQPSRPVQKMISHDHALVYGAPITAILSLSLAPITAILSLVIVIVFHVRSNPYLLEWCHSNLLFIFDTKANTQQSLMRHA